MQIRHLIGIAGVAKDENALARLWGKRFEFFMVLLAIWLPLQWYLQKNYLIHPILVHLFNWAIWLVFVIETLTLSILVKKPLQYLHRNWMDVIIIMLGIPIVWQQIPSTNALKVMQLLLILRLLLPWWDATVHFLSLNRLGTTLITAFVTATLAGMLMSIIDPAFHSPWTGIWWAWETVTTVGYGDYTPTSFLGRLLGIFVMVIGLALLSLITANFAAYFVSKGTNRVTKTEDLILKNLEQLQNRLDKIEEQIKANKDN